jgi:hypothetical protein
MLYGKVLFWNGEGNIGYGQVLNSGG